MGPMADDGNVLPTTFTLYSGTMRSDDGGYGVILSWEFAIRVREVGMCRFQGSKFTSGNIFVFTNSNITFVTNSQITR